MSLRQFIALASDATEAERAATRVDDAVEEVASRASDAADALALEIRWAPHLAHMDRTQLKIMHTERICREAVSSGMLRYRLQSNPTTSLVK